MWKKNTKRGSAFGNIVLMFSGVFAVIAVIVNLYSLAQGVSDNKNLILSIWYKVVSFFAVRWKCALLFAAIAAIIIILIRYVQKKEMEERQTKSLSWFAAERRNTKYTGGTEYINELKRFFMQDNVDFSWWAVTGVAGIGKTRLIIETLKNDEFYNADIQWIKDFDEYREEALKKRVDNILDSHKFMNIIIAEDAQIYMDNIGILINYLTRKLVDEIGDHKIRLLLLIRMGEDEDLTDRYKQLESKCRQSEVHKTRFGIFETELRIEKYTEDDVCEVVKSYIVNTIKRREGKKLTDEQIRKLQIKVARTLKSERVDPNHLRPLFAMFIADALLSGKEPMSWSREDILEYAVVDREDEFFKLEARDLLDNRFVYDSIRGIICLSIIRDGLSLSEFNKLSNNIEEELGVSRANLKRYLREMQLLKHDGVIHAYLPDILSEYYILRTMILNPEERIKQWIIGCLYDSIEGVEECRKKVRQDFRYLYGSIDSNLNKFYRDFFKQCSNELSYEIIKKLLLEQDLLDSNAIILQEAINNLIDNNEKVKSAAVMLVDTIGLNCTLDFKKKCLSELKYLSGNKRDIDINYEYCRGLVYLMKDRYDKENSEKYLYELKRLVQENDGNVAITLEYCRGLRCLIENEDIIYLNMERKAYLCELRHLAEENNGNVKIALEYCRALSYLIRRRYNKKEAEGYLCDLKRLSEENEGNEEIALEYSRGLVYLIQIVYGKYSEEKREEYLRELNQLSEDYNENIEITLDYCKGLVYLIEHTYEIFRKTKQEKYLCELKRLSEEHKVHVEITLEYCKGLVYLAKSRNVIKEGYLKELKRLSEQNDGNVEITLEYCRGISNAIREIYNEDVIQRCLCELKRLSEKNDGNNDILYQYCDSLYFAIDSNSNHVCTERIIAQECITKLKQLLNKYSQNKYIINMYEKGLFKMIEHTSEKERRLYYFSELRRLSNQYYSDSEYIHCYCEDLLKAFDNSSKMEKKKEYISELKRLSEDSDGYTFIIYAYDKVLLKMINRSIEIKEKRKYLSELKTLSYKNSEEESVVFDYCMLLAQMISKDSNMNDNKEYLVELRHISEKNIDRRDILLEYSKGLINMIVCSPEKEVRKECFSALKALTERKEGGVDLLMTEYCTGLLFIIDDATDIRERREHFEELERMAKKSGRESEVFPLYKEGLLKMRIYDHERSDYYHDPNW